MTKPLYTTKFLSLFEIDNNGKPYYVASRSQDYNPTQTTTDAVTMFVLSPDGEKMLVTKEYRPAVGQRVISSPAGLIDPGETPTTAALRELAEEVGYTDARVIKEFPATYSSVGMTNERVQPIVVQLNSYENDGQRLGSDENIDYQWVDKNEALTIAEQFLNVTARMQLALLLFANGVLK